PRSRLFGIDLVRQRNYSWVCLGALVIVAALVDRLRRSGLGRSMMAVRDNEPAAATLGVSPARVKLVAFVIAGMIAGLAGYLYGGLLVSFNNVKPPHFKPAESIDIITLVTLCRDLPILCVIHNLH